MIVFDCPPVWTGPEYSFQGNTTESVYGLSGDVQSHGWLSNASAASLRCGTQKRRAQVLACGDGTKHRCCLEMGYVSVKNVWFSAR